MTAFVTSQSELTCAMAVDWTKTCSIFSGAMYSPWASLKMCFWRSMIFRAPLWFQTLRTKNQDRRIWLLFVMSQTLPVNTCNVTRGYRLHTAGAAGMGVSFFKQENSGNFLPPFGKFIAARFHATTKIIKVKFFTVYCSNICRTCKTQQPFPKCIRLCVG